MNGGLVAIGLLVGVFFGYLLGAEQAFDGNNASWACTRWENKPNGDCTQWTRTEGKR